MNISKSEKQILKKVIEPLQGKPGFPYNYCNIAAKKLLETLQQEDKDVRLQFSYENPKEGHAFVIETTPNREEIIRDASYQQYDKRYKNGFIGKKFPNKTLEKNRIEAKDFMQLQLKRAQKGIYNKE